MGLCMLDRTVIRRIARPLSAAIIALGLILPGAAQAAAPHPQRGARHVHRHRSARHATRRHRRAHHNAARSARRTHLHRVAAPKPIPVSPGTLTTPTTAPLSPVTPGTGSVGSRLVVGINADTQGWGTQMASRQDAVGRSGVRWLREQFNWDVIEPARGQWNWSNYDQVELDAAQRGTTVLPLLLRAPSWAQPTPFGMPSDPSMFADLVAHVVSRYGPGGTFWALHPDLASYAPRWFELWNESYYPQFANNNVDPAAYARLVKAAGLAGKAANPKAKFLMEGNDVAQVGAPGSGNWVEWLDAMYAAVPDLSRYFDGVAVHPYSKAYGPAEPSGGYIHDKFARIAIVHQDLVRHGAVDTPLWITEEGWSTCSDASVCVSPGTQAAYTSQMFGLLKTTYPYVSAVFLYRYDDLGAPASANQDTDFGLIQQNGTAKPVWSVVQAAASAG